MIEQAPSLIFEALAAVIVPVFEKAGLNTGILSFLNFKGSSSTETVSLSLILTGTISLSNFLF